MKKDQKLDLLPILVLLLAIIGFVLRRWLYAVGVDEKNLLVRNHPLELVLWLCTAAAALTAFFAGRKGYKVGSYAANFSASLSAALGHILAGSGILLTVLMNRPYLEGVVSRLWMYTGILCCPAMYWAAFDRIRGKRPFFGVYAVVAVYFALHLVSSYQAWCSDPQLQNYVFAFFASLALMLLGYYHAAFCVDGGNSTFQRFAGLMAMYCCLVALADGASVFLYGGCAVWALTGLSRPLPRMEKKAGENDAPA